jgi:diguanylate cyclase (GGDEF)-like protein
MTPQPPAPSVEAQIAQAALELARLQDQGAQVKADLDEARTDLESLNKEVEAAENRLEGIDPDCLREANEKLVLSSLRAQADADVCARTLEEVSRSAGFDPLTELPNRELFLDRFIQAIANAKRHGGRLALLFLDMNDFKTFNDTLGHAVGDLVLKQAAVCMTSVLRAVDTASRHGGDEFLILLTDIAHASDAAVVAEKVATALGTPFRIGDHVIRMTASIGICMYPEDGETPESLIDRADAAMYRAKRLPKQSFAFHADGVDSDAQHAREASSPFQSPAVVQYDAAVAEHALRIGELREANEQLVMAALSAQELQAAAEKSQARQKEVLALVAHELRNPLTPLSIAASMLHGSDAKDVTRMQHIIEQQVTHMTRLVGDLLDLSRSNTGKLRLHFRAVQLASVVDDAVIASRPTMDTRLQHFRLRLPSQPITLEADPIRLVQILCNLLDNASKYTPEAGQIGLEARLQEDRVVIRVADSGIGISPDALGRVFDLFAQDTHAIGFNSQGLGIGLTVVKELVEAHGGTVSVDSPGVGLGSEFEVSLPLHRPGPGDADG